MKWLNEPREWKAQGGNLSFVTEDKTDFWQKTFYGFHHDNGHFYYRAVEGDLLPRSYSVRTMKRSMIRPGS